jgi:hypothetical protein
VLTFRVVLALLFYDAPVFIGMSDNLWLCWWNEIIPSTETIYNDNLWLCVGYEVKSAGTIHILDGWIVLFTLCSSLWGGGGVTKGFSIFRAGQVYVHHPQKRRRLRNKRTSTRQFPQESIQTETFT